MYGGTISNNISEYYGGGIFAHQSSVYIYGGNILDNTAKSYHGGGIYIDPPSDQSIPIISNAVISGNKALTADGGAIYTDAPIMEISNTIISNNYAINGGGIHCSTAITITDSEISNNISENDGGGIYIYYYYYMPEAHFKINKSIITNNKSNSGNGGGIYLTNETNIVLEINNNSSLINNTALNGNGGGIYVADTTYSNITTDNSTIFRGNRAVVAYRSPDDATILYPNIKFASTSITRHPLNNYDINHTGDALTFNISYDANGGTGSYVGPSIMPSDSDTILSPEEINITRENYTFTRWNTKADGSGASYAPGNSIILNDNVTLYAQWEVNEYIVTFESNGGSSVDSQIVPYNGLSTRPTEPTKQCYIFEGWYIDDGTFGNKWDFNTPITEDITLYAKWIEDDSTKPSEPLCPEKPLEPENPKTGDISSILLPICLCTIITLTIGIIVLVKRLKKV